MKTIEISMKWRLLIGLASVIVGLFPLLTEKPNCSPRITVPTAITSKHPVVGNSDICTTAPHSGSMGFECRSSSWYSEKAGSKTRLDLAAYSTPEGKQDGKQCIILRIAALPNDKYQYYMTRFQQSYWTPMKYTMIDVRQSLRGTEPNAADHALLANLILHVSKNAGNDTLPRDGFSVSLRFEEQAFINITPRNHIFNSVDEYCDFVDKFTEYSEWLDKKQPTHLPSRSPL